MVKKRAKPVASASEVQRLKSEIRKLNEEVKRLAKVNKELCIRNEILTDEAARRSLTDSTIISTATACLLKQSQQNPLLMEDILEVLVPFFGFDDIITARLVCRTWKEVTTRPFLKKAMMQAKLDVFETFPITKFESIFPTTTQDSLKFKALKLEWPEYLRFLTTKDWFKEYGKNIQYIQLGGLKPECSDWTWEGLVPAAKDIEILLLKLCPNLKELVIPISFLVGLRNNRPGRVNLTTQLVTDTSSSRNVHLDSLNIGSQVRFPPGTVPHGNPKLGILLKLIFGCIASLKTLKLRGNFRSNILSKLIEAIRGKKEMLILEGLDELNILHLRIHPEVLGYLSRIKFRKLTKLKIGAFSSFDELQTFQLYEILEHNKMNLKMLVLGPRGDNNSEFCNLATMPHLPELKEFHNMSIREWTTESIDFVTRLPKLQKLVLVSDYINCTLQDVFSPHVQLRDMPHMNLKEFRSNCKPNNPEIFELIGKCFPNLETLQIQLKGSDLKSCLSQMRFFNKLQELDLDLHSSAVRETKFQDAIISTISLFPALRKLILRNGAYKRSLKKDIFTCGFFQASCLRSLELRSLNWQIADEVWDLIHQSPESKLSVVIVKPTFVEERYSCFKFECEA